MLDLQQGLLANQGTFPLQLATDTAVVMALLNEPAALAALGEVAHAAPYKAPPRAPVLGVYPRHTWAKDGSSVTLPAGEPGLQVGASLAVVMGRVACHVGAYEAMEHVAGFALACAFSVPNASHYRPAVRARARDGCCVLASHVVPAAACTRPDALAMRIWVDGQLVQETSTGARTRGVAQLIADVSEFMTLRPGDLLLLGAAHGAPLAKAGQGVDIELEGVGRLSNSVVMGDQGAQP